MGRLLLVLPIVMSGCVGTLDPRSGDLRRDLGHRDPRIRADSARLAAVEGRGDLADRLVERLEDSDPVVRAWSAVALRRLTGHDFGFRAFAGSHARTRAVARWRRWLLEDRASDATALGN